MTSKCFSHIMYRSLFVEPKIDDIEVLRGKWRSTDLTSSHRALEAMARVRGPNLKVRRLYNSILGKPLALSEEYKMML